VKDGFAIAVFLVIFAFFVFYWPDALGHADNYIEADPLVTPALIVPEWYLLPFYAILRAVPDKLGGVILMFGAIGVLFILPWLDTSKVRSMRYRPMARWFFLFFVVACLGLGWAGAELPDNPVPILGAIGVDFLLMGRVLTIYYFAYFLVILPVLGFVEKPTERPASIDASVTGKSSSAAPAAAPAE
jgi:quinol-cytochrome oxidoreductase complex cytochrome b subunit